MVGLVHGARVVTVFVASFQTRCFFRLAELRMKRAAGAAFLQSAYFFAFEIRTTFTV